MLLPRRAAVSVPEYNYFDAAYQLRMLYWNGWISEETWECAALFLLEIGNNEEESASLVYFKER